MWTRSDIKKQAKGALSGRYWRCVLMGLIFMVISNLISLIWSKLQQLIQLIAHLPVSLDEIQAGIVMKGMKAYMNAIFSLAGDTMPAEVTDMFKMYEGVESAYPYIPILFVIAALTWTVVYTFAYSHFTVGYNRFFINAASGSQKTSDIGFAFSNGYVNIAKIMFVYLTVTFIGFCLFIVPGVILTYKLIFVPYLLAENPHIKLSDAFHASARMTKGNKFKIFILQLSFIGWKLLSVLCICGVGMIFLMPYINETFAQLYLTLKPKMYQHD
jgi:uncharacterized membrane protein